MIDLDLRAVELELRSLPGMTLLLDLAVTYLDINEVAQPLNLAGITFWFVTEDGSVSVTNAANANGSVFTVTNAAGGLVALVLMPAETAGMTIPTRLQYTLYMVESDNRRSPLYYGTWMIDG